MARRSAYRFPFGSYPALRITLLFAAGIILNSFLNLARPLIYLVFAATALLFSMFHLHLKSTTNPTAYSLCNTAYLMLILLFGTLWQSLHSTSRETPSQLLLEAYHWEQLQFSGHIATIRQSSTGTYHLDIEVDTTTFNDSLQWYGHYKLRAILPSDLTSPQALPVPGQHITFHGTVYPLEEKRNPFQFGYKEYLASQHIYSQAGISEIHSINNVPGDLLPGWIALQQTTRELIDQLFDSPSSGLAKALLLGYKNDLDPKDKKAYSRAGLSHIMAVSGLHVGFLLTPFWFLIPYFWSLPHGRQIGFVILGISLAFYAGLTGFSTSVVRASLTGGLIIYGKLFNKIRNPVNLTALASLLVLILDPNELFAIGFQLSFGAVYIILLIIPAINRVLPPWVRYRWYGKILMVMIISLIVQVGLFPLTSYYFGEFSLIGPLINALVVPLLSLLVPYALLLLTLSVFIPSWAIFLNTPNQWLLLKMDRLVALSSGWNGSWISIQIDDPLLFIIWIVTIFAITSMHISRYRWKWGCLLVGLLCLQQTSGIIQKLRPNQLIITVLDVRQGDAMFIQTPGHKNILIDTGRWWPGYNSSQHIILPHLQSLGVDTLDAVFLSHPHSDHIGGLLELMEAVPIRTIYNSGIEHTSGLYKSYQRKSRSSNIPVVSLSPGDMIGVDEHIQLLVYGPDPRSLGGDLNNTSLILELVYGETEFLFMGDAGGTQEKRLLSNFGELIDSDFLKVGHHGSRGSSSRNFLEAVSPQISVISLNKTNRYGHPHRKTVLRLLESGSRLYFTSLDRAVVFSSDGTSIRLTPW